MNLGAKWWRAPAEIDHRKGESELIERGGVTGLLVAR
jgi:hypothetical protein